MSLTPRCTYLPSGKLFTASALAGVVSLLSACGSSSDSDPLSGQVFASQVSGAQVSLLDTAGNVLAGPVDTGAYASWCPAAR